MFLLIQRVNYEGAFINKFTFQYVSINTRQQGVTALLLYHLHSNMFLLIHTAKSIRNGTLNNLHSNMFLLIPIWAEYLYDRHIIFTFQYVSINTLTAVSTSARKHHLHSNMFLLIPEVQV